MAGGRGLIVLYADVAGVIPCSIGAGCANLYPASSLVFVDGDDIPNHLRTEFVTGIERLAGVTGSELSVATVINTVDVDGAGFCPFDQKAIANIRSLEPGEGA